MEGEATMSAFANMLEARGVTRRDFMKLCGTVAAAAGLSQLTVPQVAQALETSVIGATKGNLYPVIWIEGASCTGCTESFAQAQTPNAAEVVLDMISLNYSETLSAAAGYSMEEAKEQTIEAGDYILIYEGAIQEGWGGNALRVAGKKMEDVHIVLNGPGAAGTAIIKMLMTAGAKDIVAVDQFGTLYKGCNSAEAHKNWLGEVTNPRQIKGGLKEAIEGADVFIGVSRPGILTTELCKTMNKDAIVFAMANPTPEIMPDEAKAGGVRVMATGRSDFPNQVNNVLCFPGLFKGALSVRARDINDQMKLAAAYAIADLITDADRSEENIIPGAFDPRVAEAVAAAVAKAARETGVARL